MTFYKDLMPEYSGPAEDGLMDDVWWARFGLEEAAMDRGVIDPHPAHDRLNALMNPKKEESK